MAFWALKPHAHVFIFTSRLLGSHLFKHLKNTLLSPARELLDQQTSGMCCRVNAAPKIDGRRDLSVKKPGNRSQLPRGVYQERVMLSLKSAHVLCGLTFFWPIEELINFVLFLIQKPPLHIFMGCSGKQLVLGVSESVTTFRHCREEIQKNRGTVDWTDGIITKSFISYSPNIPPWITDHLITV